MKGWVANVGYISIVIVAFLVGAKVAKVRYRQVQPADTITITKDSLIYDTITITQPVPVDRVTVDSVKISVHDTLYIKVPIEQTHYSDSLYDAWVSGYRAKLDSIKVHTPTRYIYNEKVITKVRRPKVVISAGIYGGVGIRSPDIGVGITVGIPIWYW